MEIDVEKIKKEMQKDAFDKVYSYGYKKGYDEGMVIGLFEMKKIINKKLKTDFDLEFNTISEQDVKDFIKTGKWSCNDVPQDKGVIEK